MDITLRLIATLRPYPENPRVITPEAVAKVTKSLQAFGFRQPIVVDPDGVIVIGHVRYQAAMQLGLDTVPVHVAEGLTPEQVAALRIADNRTGEETRWDTNLLPAELARLSEAQLVGITGFDPAELDKYLGPMDFDPIPVDEVKALDQLNAKEPTIVTCPECGHEFEA